MAQERSEAPPSCLYAGEVMHKRLIPVQHKLSYRVFSLFLDIDRLDDLAASSRLFGYNRRAPIAFFDRDHGPRDGSHLRPWIEKHLRDSGLDLTGGPIRLLCFPRLWGFVFNPLSVYYCYDANERLAAVLYYVSNTFGEQHSYLLPVTDRDDDASAQINQRASKKFYVSPFNAVEGEYRFRLTPPGDRLALLIRQYDGAGQELLLASHTAQAQPFGDRALATALVRHPLMTYKVIAGIHWEALKLWLKGVKLVDRPAPPKQEVSL